MRTCRCSFGPRITPIVRTRVIVRITAFPSADRNRNTPFGRTKNLTRQSPVLRSTWRFIPHGLMQSKSCLCELVLAKSFKKQEVRRLTRLHLHRKKRIRSLSQATEGRKDYKLRRTSIRLSILRAEEFLPDLRLCSMHNPEKKTNTISATDSGSILDPSASMFFTSRRFIVARLCATIAGASSGKIANSRIELIESPPFGSSFLRGPRLRNVSMFFHPRG